MKKEYRAKPESMKSIPTYGFSWVDFVTAIPSPLFVVTSYTMACPMPVCNRGQLSWAAARIFTALWPLSIRPGICIRRSKRRESWF